MYFNGFNLQVISPMYMRMGVASSMLMGLSYHTYVCVCVCVCIYTMHFPTFDSYFHVPPSSPTSLFIHNS